MTGIYKIQSISNPDKIYIGSAINISQRWDRHLNDLRKNKHCNRHLQRHFNLYGENDLSFEILEKCKHIQLLKFEQLYIDILQPSFNICAVAGSRFGCVATFATREKIRVSAKRRNKISMFKRLAKPKS